jgi:putative ABC transport system ATP-binding protein
VGYDAQRSCRGESTLPPSYVLEAQQITRQFPFGNRTVQALRGVSFHITAGEFVAFMGPSGSGKTTLLQIAGGLLAPSAGAMLLDGVDLASLRDRQLAHLRRDRLGYVFQFYNLIPTLDTLENIGLPLLLKGESLLQHQDRLLDLAELFGLRGRERDKPDRLSAGEQQRVALARALVMRPSILMADEPTGNLDFVNGREILQLLWESCVNFGQTTLLVTHDIRAARYADRVYFLRDGLIISELVLGREEDHTNAGPLLTRLQELGL